MNEQISQPQIEVTLDDILVQDNLEPNPFNQNYEVPLELDLPINSETSSIEPPTQSPEPETVYVDIEELEQPGSNSNSVLGTIKKGVKKGFEIADNVTEVVVSKTGHVISPLVSAVYPIVDSISKTLNDASVSVTRAIWDFFSNFD